jgi:hypothetical protein
MSGHFVYMYRHKNGIPFYVGYGIDPKRAASHAEGSHNKELKRLVDENKYILEIAGPFDSEATGRAVETALISAFRLTPSIGGKLVNKDPGGSAHRFRPYGLPYEFVDRLSEPPLNAKEIEMLAGGPILAVYVSAEDFRDGRMGFDPSAPPTNEQIIERISRYWPLKASIARWGKNPALMPKFLIGFSGGPNSRIVIGAVPIQSVSGDKWELGKKRGIIVPVVHENAPGLDSFKLRGRRAIIAFRRDGLQKG